LKRKAEGEIDAPEAKRTNAGHNLHIHVFVLRSSCLRYAEAGLDRRLCDHC
jgi:hypothetical protein